MQLCKQCGNLFEDERLECPNCGKSVSRKIVGINSPLSQFARAVKTCFCKYVSFKGRASRSEFWYWILFCWLVGLLESVLWASLPKSWTPEAYLIRLHVVFDSPNYVNSLFRIALVSSIIRTLARPFTLALFLPTVAVSVRRLHDAGFSCVWTILYYVAKLLLLISHIAISQYMIDHLYDTNDGILFKIMVRFETIVSILLTTIAFFFMIKEGEVGANKYGEDPRECDNTNA